jgi:hypothetical protein
MNKIEPFHIENILGFKLNPSHNQQIIDLNLVYDEMSKFERDEYLLSVIDVLNKDITCSGEHRINEWENGWSENLQNFKKLKDIKYLIPKYHGKYNIARWMGDVVTSEISDFDYKIHICMVDAILQHYLKDCKNIYEFGCGSAYHLIRLNNFNSDFILHGSDWAHTSQKIIKEINDILDININMFNFNFFNPDFNINLGENSGIYTIAALEQVGENFKAFVDYLLNKKPSICIHLEPIDELLDENKLIDKLSIMYFRKRNYLKGFLPYLEELEREDKIEIIKKQRIFTGSYFIEGHSLIVWRIKNENT